MRLSVNFLVIITILFAIGGNSCLKSKKEGIPEDVIVVLNNSGIYKPSLMKVILEFQKPADSLKLQAAYFIIRNLEHNYTIERILVDSSGNTINIDIHNFKNLKSIKNHLSLIEKEKGKPEYKSDSIWLDFKNIDPEFLIDHINTSYGIWMNQNLGNRYDFDKFCKYILPYRVSNERIEPYISHFQKLFAGLYDQNKDLSYNVIEINRAINTKLKYDDRFEIFPNPQSIKSIETNKSGDHCDINIYKIKALRSMGIAATLDYTPFFADSTLGYYTTTVILPDNSKIYLNNPDEINQPYQKGNVAKVYRRTFVKTPGSLFSIKETNMHTPPFLGNYNYVDVTNEYISTEDILLKFNDTINYAYIAVFNDGEWRPVSWAIPDDNGIATFKNMGTDLAYKPVIINRKKKSQVTGN